MAGPDFTTVGGELTYWFSHITQRFKGGWDGSGENGIDVGMPTGTPVYAVAGGTVVGHGYYAGGGVVSVEQEKGMVWYYQHLDLAEPGIESGQVTQVQPGQLIGWSGGQLSGGRHPSSRKFSTGPHIEVGVNAPWGGIWGPKADKGPNVDPLPFLEAIAQSGGGGTTGTPYEPAAYFGSNDCSQYNPVDPRGWLCALTSRFQTLTMWLADPLRILKLGAGVALFGIAALMVIGSLTLKVAPTGYELAATAAGQPEIAAGARALKSGGSTGQRARTGARLYRASRASRQRTAAPAPKPPKAAPAPKPPKAAKPAKEEPVYYGGKQIGTAGPDGVVRLKKKAG